MANNTYNQLQRKLAKLEKISPYCKMVRYKEFIKRNEISIYEESNEMSDFMKTFQIPWGTTHKYVLLKCLARIKEKLKHIRTLEDKVA